MYICICFDENYSIQMMIILYNFLRMRLMRWVDMMSLLCHMLLVLLIVGC